jgi:hypothetical protein
MSLYFLQLLPHIFTKVVFSLPAHVEVYSIQHYVLKFVSDLQRVGGLHRVLWFPPSIKLTTNDIAEILLKLVLNTITVTPSYVKIPVILFPPLLFCNYSLVRILCIIYAFFQNKVYKQLESYFIENNLLYQFQSGFRSTYSTCLMILALFNSLML